MSHREPNDSVMYALPEESRRRLQQLHGHIALLSRLAHASTQGEAQARAPDGRLAKPRGGVRGDRLVYGVPSSAAVRQRRRTGARRRPATQRNPLRFGSAS